MTQQQITLDNRIKIHEQVVYEKVGDEMVLLHLESNDYFGINEVGSRMWELLSDSGNPRYILDCLQDEYDVEPDVLRQDLEHFLKELEAQKLIKVESVREANDVSPDRTV